jgi:hypothetical protein
MKYMFEIDVIGECTLTEFLELIEHFKVEEFKNEFEHPTVVLSTDKQQSAIDFLTEYHDAEDDLDWVKSQIKTIP